MKKPAKYFIALLFLIGSLLLGLEASNNLALAFDDPPNGYVCPEDQSDENRGICEDNDNQTICSWGPGGCVTSPANTPGTSP